MDGIPKVGLGWELLISAHFRLVPVIATPKPESRDVRFPICAGMTDSCSGAPQWW